MKLALLGADAETIELVEAAAARPDVHIVWAAELGPMTDAVRRIVPSLRPVSHWEELVGGKVADAVAVAGDADEEVRADQLRKLVQAGVPLLVAHPVLTSMLVYYELDMIRQESHDVMLPFLPARWHPATVRVAEACRGTSDTSGLGRVEQVVFERMLADRTQANVWRWFSRDVDLLRYSVGELNRLGAMSAPNASQPYSTLGLQLAGSSGAMVRWAVAPVEGTAGGRLTVLGEHGKLTLWMPESGAWQLDWAAGGETRQERFEDWSAGDAAIDRLQSAIDGGTCEPDWRDACRAVELADAIARSLKRGRTIELEFDDYTEAGTFKGLMASVGCGLLLAAPIVLVIAAWLANAGVGILRFVPHILVGVLGLFLAAQLFSLVFPRER